MSEEQWRENHRNFRFEPPEGPPESWSDEDYTYLADRVIVKGDMSPWECQQCTKPFRSLRRARSHVNSQHMDHLVEKAVNRQ